MTVSVVTGASTGIGFATALRLAQEGHQVHASVRSKARMPFGHGFRTGSTCSTGSGSSWWS